MKKLAHYYGKVNRLGTPPEPSYVTIKDSATGNTVDTDAITQILLDAKINEEGCQFEIIISEDLNGQVNGEIFKLNPKAPPPAVLPNIKAKTQEQLDRIDKITQTHSTETKSQKERIEELERKILELQKFLSNK